MIAQLEALVAQHPLRERLRGQLMLALYRSGRQAEALEAFAAGRRMLVDELGIEPGEPLRALHQRILEQDPALAAPHPAAADRPPRADGRRRRRAAVLAAGVLAAAVAVVVLAVDGEQAAAPGPPANSLVLLDAESGRVQATIDVGGTPTSVAVGEGAAWVLNADDQTITRVDERTRAARTFGSGGVPTDLGVGAGALWVGNGKRTRAQFIGPVATSIVRVDPSTTAVRAAVSLPKRTGSRATFSRITSPSPRRRLGGQPGRDRLPRRPARRHGVDGRPPSQRRRRGGRRRGRVGARARLVAGAHRSRDGVGRKADPGRRQHAERDRGRRGRRLGGGAL